MNRCYSAKFSNANENNVTAYWKDHFDFGDVTFGNEDLVVSYYTSPSNNDQIIGNAEPLTVKEFMFSFRPYSLGTLTK